MANDLVVPQTIDRSIVIADVEEDIPTDSFVFRKQQRRTSRQTKRNYVMPSQYKLAL
jgi:hypothetical protein